MNKNLGQSLRWAESRIEQVLSSRLKHPPYGYSACPDEPNRLFRFPVQEFPLKVVPSPSTQQYKIIQKYVEIVQKHMTHNLGCQLPGPSTLVPENPVLTNSIPVHDPQVMSKVPGSEVLVTRSSSGDLTTSDGRHSVERECYEIKLGALKCYEIRFRALTMSKSLRVTRIYLVYLAIVRN